MSNDTIPSISASIDDQSRSHSIRRSLQSRAPIPVHPVRRQSSLGKNRTSNNLKKPSVPDIPEVERSDDDNTENNNLTVAIPKSASAENVRISFTKKTRKSSNISKTSKMSVNGAGFVNYGYDQQSTRSSLHGSMSSLPVIREQYCCCARWTKMERNLAAIVAILALIIIALVIAIGVVMKGGEDGEQTRFYASVMKF